MSIRHSSISRRVRRTAVGAVALAWILAGPAAAGFAATNSTNSTDDNDNVEIQNTETVQVYTNSSGKVDSKRIYEQLVLTGHGDVSFSNPVSTDNLRNLDGFSSFDVKDGAQQISTTVDGQERMRSLSDFGGTLPLSVSVSYTLDGKEISPRDVVGKSGDLEVSYHVENTTGRTEQIQVDDGKGGTVTRDVDVVIPMVGQLVTFLPSTYTDVTSDQANIAGDGRGGTKMTFTLTLVPPIGSPSADFSYRAHITDGVIPDATMSALPVDPLQSSSLKKGAAAYESGTETGTDLTAGATKIDTNLLRLRDGAAKLSVGLMKLYKGSSQLSDGLVNDAVPGTSKLADGSTQLSDGADRLYAGSGDLVGGIHQIRHGTSALHSGTSDLSNGADQVRSGASDVRDGAAKLRNGASDVNDGALQLNAGAIRLAGGQKSLAQGLTLLYQGVDQLPQRVQHQLATNSDYQTLLGTLDKVVAGIGDVNDSPAKSTVLGGLNAIDYAMRYPTSAGTLDCAVALAGGTPTKCGAMDGVDFIAGQLSSGANDLNQLKGATGPLVQLNGCITVPGSATVPAPPTSQSTQECGAIASIYYGLYSTDPTNLGAQAKVMLAASKLWEISAKVDNHLLDTDGDPQVEGLPQLRKALSNSDAQHCDRADPAAPNACGMAQALTIIRAGIPQLVNTLTGEISTVLKGSLGVPTAGCNPHTTLRCAAAALAAGSAQLADGSTELADGTRRLSDGTVVLADGTVRLADGTVRLDDGAHQLDSGAGRLDDGAVALGIGGLKLQLGAGQLADGSGQLDGGLQRLLAGLTSAADGSTQLRDGLQTAAGGAPQVTEGATKLSKKGTSKLVDKGSETAIEYGVKYAEIQAGAERAHEDGMAFGAPAGAVGLTAYTFEIRGENGEGTRNWHRSLAAAGIFGLGVGIYALRRRFV